MRWAVAGVGVMVLLLVVVWWRAGDAPVRGASAATADGGRGAPIAVPREAAAPPSGELRLAGIVVDEHGAPVEGARIELAGFAVGETTDATGSFAIDNVAAGHYRIAAHAPDASASADVDLTATSPAVVLTLQPLATATIHVVDDRDGHPLAGATIAKDDHDKGVTDENGVYEIHGLPSHAGFQFNFDVAADGYEAAAAMFAVDEDPHKPNLVEVRLRRGAAVGGTVVDDEGHAVPEATVETARTADAMQHEAITDETGHWHLAALAAGTKTFTASAPGQIATAPLLVELDGVHPREDIVVHVAVGGRLTGRVVDEAGQPVDGATVRIEDRDSRERSTQSDGLGQFTIVGLVPGKHLISATASMRASQEIPIELGRGREPTLTLVVAPSSISGIVVDGRGAPVAGARIRGYLDESMRYRPAPETTSDVTGRFEVGGVVSGRYRISAARPGANDTGAAARATIATGARDVRLVLPDVGSVAGRVVQDGKPVRAYELVLTPAGSRSSGYPRDVRSDTGSFSDANVPAGTWTITVAGAGFARATREGIVVAPGASVDVGEIGVAHGRTIRGVVTDDSGVPVAGATVSVHDGQRTSRSSRTDMALAGLWTAQSDATGAFQLDDVPDAGATGHRKITASHPTRGSVPDQGVAADVTSLRLTLVPYGGIDGVVMGDASRLTEVALIGEVPTGPGEASVVQGAFHLDNLPAGVYDIVGSPTRLGVDAISVAAGQRTRVTLTVPPVGITVTLHVPGTCGFVTLESTHHGDRCFTGEVVLPYVSPGSYRACIDWAQPCLPITVAPSPPQQTIVLP